MHLAPTLLLLLAQHGAQADMPDCTSAITQQDMTHCAALDWQKADDALNEQWRETAAEMRRLDAATSADDGRAGYFAQLLKAQRAWLSFRDAHCTSEGFYARGGSMEPMLVAQCKAELTRERTRQLRELAQYPR
ncbi:lysozyme inhibitor LprI family protein [Aurantiacibacter poecillastricola]|uniref:lysozyme inhibitor LprI family protein n=1 Tax=Aurantiacibacter poecillastricola TaxID=3064385 RepID=UPI00273F4498|nr:lysozyme inhibitor LprI family protein [Aurantiacibacter sp. 219JJ12-13]MDP5261404.1 lysozyme inhibitor LprI family protein [Aurantiacibacter sp. 219JJ12-13]